jgi:probable rRNA maturation factor
MVEVTVNDVKLQGKEEEIIRKVVKKVLKEEGIKHDVDVYITLTNNEEIRKINKEYRNIDKPTDVLSFPMYEKEEIRTLKKAKEDDVEEILGDIVISVSKVIAQAKEYGHSYERELAYLTTHGMLHLLGYDHMEEEEKEEMREHEEAVLRKLNISRD